ncbi:hypothetical protein K3727_00655 [Rhodobacteraceae bacterium M382]|nr:hypothetical protein K3727_00655 [Rhodobacteraceae bacterium M382]
MVLEPNTNGLDVDAAHAQLTFRCLCEQAPDDAWRRVVAHGWPGWREWFTSRGGNDLPITEAHRALRRFMPEFEPLVEELNQATNPDESLQRFLTFWCPPRYLVNCSQAVIVDDKGPFLIRNYDLDPALNEATLLTTSWRSTRVMGMVEAMAGLADGMNEHGLTASLTFGGRINVGKGFGIPLIMRYLLQMCRDTQDAVDLLRAVPAHMSYNITLIDASGDWSTVMVAPDRPTIVRQQPWATNHQLGVEWPRHGRISNTLGRAQHLERLLEDTATNACTLHQTFRQKPVFSTNYRQGFGTVYTAAYRPLQREVQLSWSDGTTVVRTMDQVGSHKQPIAYFDSGSRAPATPTYTPPAWHPDWYDVFVKATHPAHSGPEQVRLAAFWRRNHFGQDHDWWNLLPNTTDILQEDS